MNIHRMKENSDRIPLRYTSWSSATIIRPLTRLLLVPAVALLLLTTGFADTLRYGAEKWEDRPGQQNQIWSRVNYDPIPADPFFESNGLLYSRGYHPYKHKVPGKESHREKHTAECFSNAIAGRGLIKFCDAKFIGSHMIDLLIHVKGGFKYDGLRIWIRDGKFKSQYWGDSSLGYRTTRQKLTLDKKTYQKGDVIKGRIDFECMKQGPFVIKVYGFFKTIVE
jgi:hypothetical protein